MFLIFLRSTALQQTTGKKSSCRKEIFKMLLVFKAIWKGRRYDPDILCTVFLENIYVVMKGNTKIFPRY